MPPVYTEVKGSRLIFTINMEDFHKKSRDIAGGRTVDALATLTYSSVVSRETVQIAFTLPALNDVEFKSIHIHNSFLIVSC